MSNFTTIVMKEQCPEERQRKKVSNEVIEALKLLGGDFISLT